MNDENVLQDAILNRRGRNDAMEKTMLLIARIRPAQSTKTQMTKERFIIIRTKIRNFYENVLQDAILNWRGRRSCTCAAMKKATLLIARIRPAQSTKTQIMKEDQSFWEIWNWQWMVIFIFDWAYQTSSSKLGAFGWPSTRSKSSNSSSKSSNPPSIGSKSSSRDGCSLDTAFEKL